MRLASSASCSSSSCSPSPDTNSAPLPSPAHPSKLTRRRMEKELNQAKSGYPLQRGSACLSCRKRKMKCDAGKPSCAQCIKANRAPDCDYDDGKSKSRTQLLQDKIATLEGRIRELEGPPGIARTATATATATAPANLPTRYDSNGSDAPPPPILYDHVLPGMFTTGHASFDPSAMSLSQTSSSSPAESPWIAGQYDMQHTPDSLHWADIDPLSMTPEDMLEASGRWWDTPQPPSHIQQLLVNMFLPHRHQCGFEVDPRRFQASLTSARPPHPALLNAIYALACHFSLSPLLTPHEMRFVSRALCAIPDALSTSGSLLDVLHGSALLAVLFFIKGRLLEGCYHAGAAVRLAVSLGLHQISPQHDWVSPHGSPASTNSSGSHHASGTSILPPPADSVELGERILAFWQVFNIDRCWAVATGLPVALSDSSNPRTRIETVWPRSVEDYELSHVNEVEYSTVHYLYSQVTALPFSPHDSPNALRAKATTLFERAARLASSFGTSAQTAEQFWTDFQSVDAAIAQLSVSVPPVVRRAEDAPEVRVNLPLFAVHVLLHAAMLQLHAPFALKDAASQQKSAAVAGAAARLVHELDEADYPFLDPILGTCWTTVAEVLVREVLVLRSANALDQMDGMNRQLDIVIAAMNRLGAHVPLTAYQASKVEQSRVVTF